MKIHQATCPECGRRVAGIIEELSATAWLNDFGDSFDYMGESKVHYDTQEAKEDGDGQYTVTCDHNHFWQSDITW